MKEDEVQECAKNWLRSKGYTKIRQDAGLHKHGVDIRAEHKNYTRNYLVEAKGDPTSKNPASSISSNFTHALGQIVERMKSKSKYKYALAFTEAYEKTVLRRLPYLICKNLRLNVLIVNKKKEIRNITWKELKKTNR